MAQKRVYTPAHKKATLKYEKEHIYRATCKFPKDMESIIKNRADELGYDSINAYLKSLVNNDIFGSVVDEPSRETFIDAP